MTRQQISRLLAIHKCEALTWPHGTIAAFSPRHALALLGSQLIEALERVEALEAGIRRHKNAMANPGYMSSFDDHSDLWQMVNDDGGR